MTFKTLAEYFGKLEATSKRLEMIDILSKLFKEAKPEEIGKICYLIQGRVAPFFEPVEIGMAEKMVATAIAKAFETSKEDVIKSYRQLGNMGITASKLSQKSKIKNQKSKMSVGEVFEELAKIAQFSGEGTVGKKVSTLSDLLLKLDSDSVKHVVNIPLGTLRLGIGGPTVLDALSLAKKGDKSLRPVLENAYNKTSDLGYIAENFFKKGEAGIKHVQLVVGKPVRPALAERLPSAAEVVKRVGGEFAAEPKFDGFRVQVHLDRLGRFLVRPKVVGPAEQSARGPAGSSSQPTSSVRTQSNRDQNKSVSLRALAGTPSAAATPRLTQVRLFSRNLEDTTQAFPDLVKGVLDEVRAKTAILEGEAIAYNPQTNEFLPFQETTKRRRKYKIEEMAEKLPLVMFAFDLLYLNGKDLTILPYRERRKLLEKIVAGRQERIRLADERILHNEKEILDFFNEAVSEGLEGLMIKKLDSPYVAGGRGFHWIKFKRGQAGELTDTIDCVILGIYAGRGKRTGFGAGGLLVGVYDQKKDEFVTISRVGTGLTDEEWRQIKIISDKLQVTKKPARVNSQIEPPVWIEPKIVLEIYADEITRSPIHTAGKTNTEPGYALRFPRLVKFREADKRPEDATTVEEVEKMYKQQYRKR